MHSSLPLLELILDLAFQIRSSPCLGKLLDRIPQHVPRHLLVVFLKKVFFWLAVSIANLTQHPPDRPVDQVVFVVHVPMGKPKPVLVVELDQRASLNHRDTLMPKVHGFDEFAEEALIPVTKLGTQNLVGRIVDEIPVVYVIEMVQVEDDDLLSSSFVRSNLWTRTSYAAGPNSS